VSKNHLFLGDLLEISRDLPRIPGDLLEISPESLEISTEIYRKKNISPILLIHT
jgi:hypothetical protein